MRRHSPSPFTRRGAAVAAVTAALAFTLMASAPAADAATPSRLPAAGGLLWPSVTVRTAPRTTARRKMVLYELRRDYRPQIVLAIGMRRVGYVAASTASVTLANTAGTAALQLTARLEGDDGNVIHVQVTDGGVESGQDELVVFGQGVAMHRFVYAEGDVAGLANAVNQSAAPVAAKAQGVGPLAAVGDTSLRGGRDGNPGKLWYRLNLPIRPFGQTGWVPAESVDVRPTTKRVVVHRSRKVVEVFRGSRRVFRARVAVGRPDRKTPLGRFYVAAKYVPPRNALVSTYALELSAPAGLPDFLRGGVVGIHGTPATYTIGKAASNGCIRVAPRVARALRRIVPLGTPVRVVRY